MIAFDFTEQNLFLEKHKKSQFLPWQRTYESIIKNKNSYKTIKAIKVKLDEISNETKIYGTTIDHFW